MTSENEGSRLGESPLGFSRHDHSACVNDTIAAAEARCNAEGLRFTPVRRKVLEILLQEHRALGAYIILDKLREDGFGSQPPVAYRALDFLVANGFAHKIERLNAFIACVLERFPFFTCLCSWRAGVFYGLVLLTCWCF